MSDILYIKPVTVGDGMLQTAAALSATKQVVTDNLGNTSPLSISTSRLFLGTSTGTSLLNFPDAGTTAADGISFGSGTSLSLFRNSNNQIQFNGSLRGTNLIIDAIFANNTDISVSSVRTFSIASNALTGSQATSALSITQTHNTTGSPDVIKIDIANTASGANTRYLNFYTSGTSNFSMDRLGNMFYLNNKDQKHKLYYA